jgi:hypothetical protein
VTVEEDVESTSQSALENKSWITMSDQLLHSIEWEMAKAKEIHPIVEANKSLHRTIIFKLLVSFLWWRL